MLDCSADSVKLLWERPLADGGSKTQGHKIEMRDVTEELWRDCNDYLVRDTVHQVNNLNEGCEYEFRVKAKNAAGFSKPSAPSSRARLRSQKGVPAAPGTPQVAKVTRSYVDLKWEPPTFEGEAASRARQSKKASSDIRSGSAAANITSPTVNSRLSICGRAGTMSSE